MDALDILGGLLSGGRSPSSQPNSGGSGGGGGGFGGRILEELLKAGTSRPGSAAPAPAPSKATSRAGGVSPRSIDMASEVSRLEDLLGVANGRRPVGTSDTTTQSSPTRQTATSSQNSASRQSAPSQQNSPEEALVLVQAMINAAKSDGKLDQDEQQAILSRVPNDDATINFLRKEFARPLDVREFTWNVPLGLEVQVYTISLATIQVDTREEVQYLKDLARGLRLAPDLCNQLHAKFGVRIAF